MDLSLILAITSLALSALVIVLLVVLLVRTRSQRRSGAGVGARATDGATHAADAATADDTSADEDAVQVTPQSRYSRIAVVLNPSKSDDPARFRARVRDLVTGRGEPAPVFYDTSVEDAGRGQAEQALADGADLVIAAGGDGTVRMVAAALAHTDVSMAILPLGTGNLVARNLQVPLGDVEGALEVAISGPQKATDMAWLRTGHTVAELERAASRPFMVLAGVGADAEIMSITDPVLKRRIGWWAYVWAGFQRVFGHPYDAQVQLAPDRPQQLKARTILIGNVGKLTAGVVLMPEANAFNRRLEVLVLDWLGPAGLGQIVTQLVAPKAKPIARVSTMQRAEVEEIRVVTAKPQPVELDGDAVGEATHLVAKVDPGALRMQVPEGV